MFQINAEQWRIDITHEAQIQTCQNVLMIQAVHCEICDAFKMKLYQRWIEEFVEASFVEFVCHRPAVNYQFCGRVTVSLTCDF